MISFIQFNRKRIRLFEFNYCHPKRKFLLQSNEKTGYACTCYMHCQLNSYLIRCIICGFEKMFWNKIPMKLAIFECTNGNNTVLSYEWDRNHIEIHVISCNLSSTPLCCCSVGETYFGTGWCWRHYMWVTEFKKTKLPKRDNKKSPHVVVRFEDHQHFFRYLSPNI